MECGDFVTFFFFIRMERELLFKSLTLLNSLFFGYSGNGDFLQIYNKLFLDSIFCMQLNIHYLLLCFNRMECLQALEMILEYFLKTFCRRTPKFPRGFYNQCNVRVIRFSHSVVLKAIVCESLFCNVVNGTFLRKVTANIFL